MSKIVNSAEMGIVEPLERIKHLASYGSMVEVDPNVPIRRYYRSGMEMVRMANVYLSEGNHENAYILNMRFMILFLEKIPSHPEYKSVPTDILKTNKEKLVDVMSTTEKLKLKLLDKFGKEYTKHLEERKREELLKAKRAKEEENKSKQQQQHQPSAPQQPAPPPSYNDSNAMQLKIQPIPSADTLNQVVYPNDFPTEPNKSTGGLLLGDSNNLSSGTNSRPTFDRTLKPSVEHSDSLIEGILRFVSIPEDAMTKFLILADKNTTNNIETCGILAGTLAYNKMAITHIIVPKQNGTSDSCNTMNEEEIFDIQDQKNLITLGWIHTHPSQTAFLSSVDLHTHCSYQIMLPEAIAIVCAPKYNSTGFFCLTPNYGLDYIAQCRQSGFHPHPNDPPLFMDAPHVTIDDNAKIEVVDLRR